MRADPSSLSLLWMTTVLRCHSERSEESALVSRPLQPTFMRADPSSLLLLRMTTLLLMLLRMTTLFQLPLAELSSSLNDHFLRSGWYRHLTHNSAWPSYPHSTRHCLHAEHLHRAVL